MSSPHLKPHSEHISRAVEILVTDQAGIRERLLLALKSTNLVGIKTNTLMDECQEIYQGIMDKITHNETQNYENGIYALSLDEASEVADKIFEMYKKYWGREERS